MSMLLWVFQILLALHTMIGAIWKFSNSEQTVPSLRAIPHGLWMSMSVVELLCTLVLIIPASSKSLDALVPIAAACVGVLFFSGVHIYSGDAIYEHLIYWLVVAALCAVIAYGKFVLKPNLLA
jgi:hypothetical protein